MTTVQALMLGNSYAASMGKDRMGAMFRFAAVETFRRLDMTKKITSVLDQARGPSRIAFRSAISRAVWSLFCTEW